jgi:hypothetical protein
VWKHIGDQRDGLGRKNREGSLKTPLPIFSLGELQKRKINYGVPRSGGGPEGRAPTLVEVGVHTKMLSRSEPAVPLLRETIRMPKPSGFAFLHRIQRVLSFATRNPHSGSSLWDLSTVEC